MRVQTCYFLSWLCKLQWFYTFFMPRDLECINSPKINPLETIKFVALLKHFRVLPLNI